MPKYQIEIRFKYFYFTHNQTNYPQVTSLLEKTLSQTCESYVSENSTINLRGWNKMFALTGRRINPTGKNNKNGLKRIKNTNLE